MPKVSGSELCAPDCSLSPASPLPPVVHTRELIQAPSLSCWVIDLHRGAPAPSPTLAELLDNPLPLSCTGAPWSVQPRRNLLSSALPLAVGQASTYSETRSHLGE